jgi:hypothetical protein
MAMATVPVLAADLSTPEPGPATTQGSIGGGPAGSALPGDAAAGVNSDDAQTPTSTEQGQTQMSESFEHRPLSALLSQSRLVGLQDTSFSVQLRSYYLNRDTMDHTISEAWTLGGLAGFKTGYFYDLVAIGATGYTSQALYAPSDRDGTPLLGPQQTPYTVMGELYGEFKITPKILATIGKRGFDTPYINTQDAIMTPYTFQVYGIQGVVGNTDDQKLNFGAAYVDKIKPRTSEDFESMSTYAGAPAGVDRGVYVTGANYIAGQLAIGATEYYCADIINIVYPEVKYTMPLADRMRLLFHAQYTDQHSTGDALLTGSSFSTHQSGFKAELAIGSALLTVARTITAVGTVNASGSGTSMRNPWGGYPGYTASQIENFYRAGEDATMLRAAYNFPKKTGLSIYGLWVHGSTPSVVNEYAQDEYDANLEWSPQSVTGLRLLARYAHVSQAGPTDQHEDELRLILYYELR